MLRLLVNVNAVPISPILVTLMIEAIRPSETSVPTIATRRNIPEDGIIPVIGVLFVHNIHLVGFPRLPSSTQ
jgi:hypothetical protein